MEHDENAVYIDERYRTLTQPEPPYQRKTFSFEKPHTCCHCQNILITFAAGDHLCLDCSWKGVEQLATDGWHRLCGQCSKPYKGYDGTCSAAALDYTLTEAIAASKEGCALYELFVDAVVMKRKDSRVSRILRSAASKFRLWGIHYKSKSGTNYWFNLILSLISADNSTTDITSETLCGDLNALVAWTTASDPAAKYISCRPYERDVKSNRSMEFSLDCFRECLENHSSCASIRTDKADCERRALGLKNTFAETVDIVHVPSRLIYVGSETEQSQVVLVEIKEAPDDMKADVCRLGFATLSYCWGGDQPLRLTKASYQDLKTGVLVSKLPQTLQDAVWVIRKLEIKYLWIDALCIYQDSDEDKTSELARMATYYSRAIVTICAAAASRSTEGFLHARWPSPYEFGPVRLRLRDGGGEAGNVYMLQEAKAKEPTVARAWTLQESLLSRRILIFSRRQLYWCCVDSFGGCGGQHVGLTKLISGYIDKVVDDVRTMGPLLDGPLRGKWKMIVEQYTQRRLSFAADKLLAVSAVAEHLSRVYWKHEQDSIYLAGLFVKAIDPSSWLEQLLWYSVGWRIETRRPIPYRSPSWSWAAVDGPVRFEYMSQDYAMNMATVVNVSIDLVVPNARFGSVRGGLLTLESKMCPVVDYMRLAPEYRIRGDFWDDIYIDDMADEIVFIPDTKEDGAAIEAIPTGVDPGRQIFLVNLKLLKSS
ncbi:heterokaryon incompatibility protein-domain-containing protein [Nemania abortiva]|nr:heterokaryon incompatibility protein-domain-containing protein [Nemania abortiva]